MTFTWRHCLAVSLIGLVFAGCSGKEPGGAGGSSGGATASSGPSGIRVEMRDGVAVCTFPASGRDYKMGKVNGDQVALFATYGGKTISLQELKDTVAKITVGDSKDYREEQRALINSVSPRLLFGIWKVEQATVDGKSQEVREDDPVYMVLRADDTFRVIKKGRKPAGTWKLTPGGQLEMNPTNDKPSTATMKQLPDNKLELTITEDGRTITLQYTRTKLKKEPKAADE